MLASSFVTLGLAAGLSHERGGGLKGGRQDNAQSPTQLAIRSGTLLVSVCNG